MNIDFLNFKNHLHKHSPSKNIEFGNEGRCSLIYIPFEHVNYDAKLVLVGITPGPEQIKCSYSTAHSLLQNRWTDEEILKEIKKRCAFSGMRPKINEMLNHFNIPTSIGASSAESLWTNQFDFLQTTSIIPNAAYKNNKYFNGPFSDVLNNSLFKNEFNRFIKSLEAISSEAAYIAMGPVVLEALEWLVEHGHLNENQVLGYLPHASGRSGSQFGYFMRKKKLEDLKPKDPVRYRANNLDIAYKRMTMASEKINNLVNLNG